MTGSPYGETFTRSDIGNGKALSEARVNCLQCGQLSKQKVRYTFRAVARTEPHFVRLTRFVHRNVSANLKCL